MGILSHFHKKKKVILYETYGHSLLIKIYLGVFLMGWLRGIHHAVVVGGAYIFPMIIFFFLKFGLGAGTNNYVELMALKLLLMFVIKKGVMSLQVFGGYDYC